LPAEPKKKPHPAGGAPAESTDKKSALSPQQLAGVVIAYVAVVLAVDTLAAGRAAWPFDWTVFRWSPGRVYPAAHGLQELLGLPDVLTAWIRAPLLYRFDYFKFVWWFLAPLLFCLPKMDWGYLGVTRWKRRDLALLAGLAVAGAAVMLAIPHVETLRRVYPSLSHLDASAKWNVVSTQVIWAFSWLLGWEFLHRYVLLRRVAAAWPRFGWLLVPLSEGAYHLQKPLIEAAGMVLLSMALTQWAVKRRNALLPFIVHLCVEIALPLSQVFL